MESLELLFNEIGTFSNETYYTSLVQPHDIFITYVRASYISTKER